MLALAFHPNMCKLDGMLVPCIAVIDEDDGGYRTNVKVNEFRAE